MEKELISSDIVATLFEIIKHALESGEDLIISWFGKFQPGDKSARRGQNPATGDKMILPGRRAITFKSAGKLRVCLRDIAVSPYNFVAQFIYTVDLFRPNIFSIQSFLRNDRVSVKNGEDAPSISSDTAYSKTMLLSPPLKPLSDDGRLPFEMVPDSYDSTSIWGG